MPRSKKSLLSKIRSIPQLRSAWSHLKKNPRSHGVSAETIEQFSANAENRLKTIQRALKASNFRFQPVRGKRINQRDEEGKLKPRNLQIPDIPDRVILRSIVETIEPVLTPAFNLDNPASFAYLRKKGVRKALVRVVELYGEGNGYVLEADIKNFFPSINREQLLKKVYSVLPDKSINELIKQGLEQEVNLDEVEEKYWPEFQESEIGIPLGGGLSPLLANVYLASFDAQMLKAGFGLVRYADDLVVLGKTREQVKKAYELAKRILENELRLEMHPLGTKGKTQILSVRENEFKFLGVAFNGDRIWPSEGKLKKFLYSIDELGRVRSNSSLLWILNKMRYLVRGWIEAYNYTDLTPYLPSIDERIDKAIGSSALKMSWLSTARLTKQQRLYSGVPLATDYYEEAKTHLRLEEKRIFGFEPSPASLEDEPSPLSQNYSRRKNPSKNIRAWFDGVTEPINPGGTTACGAVVHINGKRVWEYSKIVGQGSNMTNNVGEYSGFLAVLNYLLAERLAGSEIIIFGDSKLVISQMFGDWEIKDGHYASLALEAKRLLKKFRCISGKWVPREKNQRADWLSKQPLIKAGVEFRIQPSGA